MTSLVGNYDFDHVPVMWEPNKNNKAQIEKFLKYINEKYNVKLENYWDLHQWTVENVTEFWAEMWDYAKVIFSKRYDEVSRPGTFQKSLAAYHDSKFKFLQTGSHNFLKVIDLSVNMADAPEWFKGARLNYAENILRFRDDHIAIISDGEEKEPKKITFAQLYEESCRYGAALRKLGLKKNDRVVCFMSNREEAVYAMLGTTAIGAIWSGASPLFGAQAAINRFAQVEPKFLFTIDRFIYDQKENEMLEKVKDISEAIPDLEKIVFVPSKPSSTKKDISNIRNSCFLEEFLSHGFHTDGSVPYLEFEQLPFNHPVFINYTSGTTGKPKVLVHGIGTLLSKTRDVLPQDNTDRNHVWLCTAPVGWASWNLGPTMLSRGKTVVLYEGEPTFLSPTSLWDMVDKYRINHLFLVPSCLDDLEKMDYVPTKENDLSSLRTITSSASVVKLQNYDFVYKKIKSDVIFGAAYGCTELAGLCMKAEHTLPVHKGEIAAPDLGYDVRCFDDAGNSILGEPGEFVIVKPTPSFPLSIWNDKDKQIYKNGYFSKYPGVFAPGDICVINPVTRGTIVLGRSDDMLNINGIKFGCSDIYNVVDKFHEIRDSLCVSQYNGRGDERAVLFLKMRPDYPFTENLVLQIREAIERELSADYVPQIIIEIQDIPYNMNGKKMEIIVKKIINKMPYSSETVTNAECLSSFVDIPELRDYN